MKPLLITKFIDQTASFSLAKHFYRTFMKVWHYHQELELVVVLESIGTRFVGDSCENFEPGEIILIGKNLPHMWVNDKIYFEKSIRKLRARAHVIHFHEDFAGSLLQTSCMAGIMDLLKRASRGVKFQDKTNGEIIKMINRMFKISEYEKTITFLDVLKRLSEQKKYKLLASTGYIDSFNGIRDSKIIAIYEYIMSNFKNEVSLNEAADLANMNPAAFSRYFKSIHKSTFVKYLNEVRIGYACKLLIENKYKISEACYESGFNNISNFNRQFKLLKNMAPSEYLKLRERAS